MINIPKQLERTKSIRPWWNYFFRNRAATVSVIAALVTLLSALIGPTLYQRLLPTDQRQVRDGIYQDYDSINGPPSVDHWLGTDYLGRDTLTRLFMALRVSLMVAFVVESLNIGLGCGLGLLAGYFGGWVDMLISRAADMLFAFPDLLLAILVSAVFGSTARELYGVIGNRRDKPFFVHGFHGKHGKEQILKVFPCRPCCPCTRITAYPRDPLYGGMGRLLLVATALSLVSCPLMARLVRSETLSLKSRDFVMASRGLRASQFRIIFRHILPNVMWLIIVAATVDVASVIVNEATVSLLGLGIEEPAASLGLMIFRAVGKIESHPLQVFIPAVVITTLVIAFSFLGDGLRDALDPHSH